MALHVSKLLAVIPEIILIPGRCLAAEQGFEFILIILRRTDRGGYADQENRKQPNKKPR